MANEGLGSRFKNAWNAFLNRDPTKNTYSDMGSANYARPDRVRMTRGNDRSIVTAIYNRIAIDAAAVDVHHVIVDEDGKFQEKVDSTLQECLSVEANLDQTGRAFMQDVVMSLLDEGCVAIVPTDTSIDPDSSDNYKILSLRTGRIKSWYPNHVKIEVYNEATGNKKEIVMLKRNVAIIENPLYAIMNEPNSTMQRLIRKLNLLDAIDEHNGSEKLDMIIQLPYTVRTEQKREQANLRRNDLEQQLRTSKYGIGYVDSTEKIIQLNRSVDNNLLAQIQYLTDMLYSQLGITKEIMDGTADEKAMLSYSNRTINPILAAITEEMTRKFLTKSQRKKGQAIKYYQDPFSLAPLSNIAEIADKFTRNEILTANEIRQLIGMKPSDDPRADMLLNSNIAQNEDIVGSPGEDAEAPPGQGEYSDLAAQYGGVGNIPMSAVKSLKVPEGE